MSDEEIQPTEEDVKELEVKVAGLVMKGSTQPDRSYTNPRMDEFVEETPEDGGDPDAVQFRDGERKVFKPK